MKVIHRFENSDKWFEFQFTTLENLSPEKIAADLKRYAFCDYVEWLSSGKVYRLINDKDFRKYVKE